MDSLTDHASLIDKLGAAAIADALADLPDPPKGVTVRAWAARNKIPPEYWPTLIAFAESMGVAVDAAWLMNTTPARKRPEPEAEAA